jgi:glucose/arabinose dehydrogenase
MDRPARASVRLVASACTALLLAGFSSGVSPAAVAEPPTIVLEPVVDGLEAPLDVAVRPAFAADTVVAEQVGQLRIVRGGVLLEPPLLDISDAVTFQGEQGLLGVAAHPDPADDRVFVYYTDLDGRQLVASFSAAPDDPDRLARDSEIVLLAMDDEMGNHNGGGLAFGPDGYLYIATGDGGGAGDPLGSGRDRGSLLGKILRIDVDVDAASEAAYAIPSDNPFLDVEGARPEVWHTGLRNPFRFRFDSETGDMWIGDVGQSGWEEVDLALAGTGGLDFGWNLMEGAHCFAVDPCADPALTQPVAEYPHDLGCTVIGGSVYRGPAQPALEGRYIFADYCSGRVFGLDAESARAPVGEGRVLEPVQLLESGLSISAIAPGPSGELLVTDLDGQLLRVAVAPEA